MADSDLPITTAAGMGPLPRWLELRAGARALERALAAARLPEAPLLDPAMKIPQQSMVELFELAARAAGDPVAGLRVGLAMTGAEFGLWRRYAAAGPTLRDGMERLAWALPLFQRGTGFSLSVQGTEAVWSYRMPRFRDADGRQHAEHVLPALAGFVRAYLGPGWQPLWLASPYPKDGRAAALAELFPAEWRFEAPDIAIGLRACDLSRPRPALPAGPPPPSSEEIRLQLGGRPAGIVEAIEAAILLDLGEQAVGLDHAARRLRLGPRSLQRRLAVHGLSYRDLLGRVRERQARALLADGGLSVAEIAHRLGYAEPGNFTRAFTRRTGRPPSAFARAG
ncbi:AraC family transcriptional regulator [Poseidonocella sp. HB161398]|uniref:helix-turn-helix transcriptional regulator n=1 Tax=Poseidonocella sp. HB161398 TaxID=2320855 RepID=UPI0011087EAE|nr:AraC family transcriptional regulator [Poseidonocella sp. HB161398]